jgi:hypothetical protein
VSSSFSYSFFFFNSFASFAYLTSKDLSRATLFFSLVSFIDFSLLDLISFFLSYSFNILSEIDDDPLLNYLLANFGGSGSSSLNSRFYPFPEKAADLFFGSPALFVKAALAFFVGSALANDALALGGSDENEADAFFAGSALAKDAFAFGGSAANVAFFAGSTNKAGEPKNKSAAFSGNG